MPVITTGMPPINKTCILFNSWFSRPVTTVTWSSQNSAFPALNLTDPSTYNSWMPQTAPSWVQFDLGSSRPVSSFGLAAHNAASSGGGIQLLSSTDGVDFSNTVVSYSPLTNEDLLFIFPEVQARYFRVRQTISPFNIGVVLAARHIEFPSTPIDSYTPSHHSKQYTKYFNNSLQGQFLGNRVMGSGGTMSVQFPHIQRDWVDGPFIGFEDHYNRGGAFFYAGWPGGKPQDMAYAWPGREDSIIDVEYVNADKLATVSFDMEFYNPT